MPGNGSENAGLRADIRTALDKAFPDGVIEMTASLEESYLQDAYPKLKESLSRIEGTTLLHERDPEGGPRWSDGSDPDEDPPDWSEPSSSYCLFFVAYADDRLTFATEGVTTHEEGEEIWQDGTGTAGCAVGVSLLAPFAAIVLNDIECYEDGSQTQPDVTPHAFNLDGTQRDLDFHYREMFEDEGLAALHDLRDRIARALDAFGIEVLPDQELQKKVPWLEADEEVCLATPFGQTDITVQDAFFHRSI